MTSITNKFSIGKCLCHQAFSKLIVSMVFIGLWHGLVFLPVLLLWFGPPVVGAAGKKKSISFEKESKPSSRRSGKDGKSNNTVDKRYRERKKESKRFCLCTCVNAEKEISTVQTYSLRARQATSPLRRRARVESRRRTRRHDQHGTHDYLVIPPKYLREWISSDTSTCPDFYGGGGGGRDLGRSGFPRIPRAKIPSICDGVDKCGQDDPRLRMKESNYFRPIQTAPVTPSAEKVPVRLPPMPFSSPASSHPACPPTPTAAASPHVDKDSLFNASYHLDDYEM